jgi:hypothetical protein
MNSVICIFLTDHLMLACPKHIVSGIIKTFVRVTVTPPFLLVSTTQDATIQVLAHTSDSQTLRVYRETQCNRGLKYSLRKGNFVSRLCAQKSFSHRRIKNRLE